MPDTDQSDHPKVVDKEKLAEVLERDESTIAEVFEAIQDGRVNFPISFKALKDDIFLDKATGVAAELLAYLEAERLIDDFVAAVLVKTGTPLSALAALVPVMGDVFFDDDSTPIDLQALASADIDTKAQCALLRLFETAPVRIVVDSSVCGSGVLVSPRLVLTAWHTVGKPGENTVNEETVVRVLACDKRYYSANVVFERPCHSKEWEGVVPSRDDATNHEDVLLLKLEKPIGYTFGYLKLDDPQEWSDTKRFALFHFPSGGPKTFTVGAVRPGSETQSRHPHTVATETGSSGGPGFIDDKTFVGLHQGRWEDRRRLIPYEDFGKLADFRNALQDDLRFTPLWSLDGTVDGHIVIGRDDFMEAIRAAASGDAPNLKVIQIRRTGASAPRVGLGFSFEILEATLEQIADLSSDTVNHCERIQPDLNSTDLIGDIARQALPSGAAQLDPPNGVASGQTTLHARNFARAQKLAERLAALSDDRPGDTWIFIEGPRDELAAETAAQLDQIIAVFREQKQLRLVLAGFEATPPKPPFYSSLNPIMEEKQPATLVEYLDFFTQQDVQTTLKRAASALGWKTSPDVIEDLSNTAIPADIRGNASYPREVLADVAEALREDLKRRVTPLTGQGG